MNFFFANKVFFYTLVVIAFLVFLYVFPLSPPADFPAGIIFRVEHGSSLRSVSLKLKEENIIRSRLVFETFVILLGREKRVIEADYYFENKFPVYEVARRIGKGEHHLAPVVVTIPEGFDAVQIADAFVPKLVNFDKSKFLSEAAGLEGYLFPDTYNMNQGTPVRDLLVQLLDNFKQRIATVDTQLKSSKYTLHQIVTLASLIEKEARTDPSRKMVAGILINRLKKGMRLDVDATVRYITENWTRPITQADLNINSPYNTRKVAGLPPGPICNPGLASIQAVLSPAASDYLYYLTDPEGVIYYAKTLDEHNANKAKYLQ